MIIAASSTVFVPCAKILLFHRILSSASPAKPRENSPRPGTPAADLQETVSPAEMDERLERLQELIDSQQSAFNKAMIGNTVDVLFERAARNPGQIVGRTAYLQPAHVFASPDIVGQVLPVKIGSLERYSLLGELAGAAARPASSTLSSMMTGA